MSTRRRSPRLAPPSSAERDDSPSEASSAPDHVDFRCQETATRRQSAPLPVVLVGRAKDTGRVAVVDMASVPKTAGFHDVVEVMMSAAREENRGSISEETALRQQELNTAHRAQRPRQTTNEKRGDDNCKVDTALPSVFVGQKRPGKNRGASCVVHVCSTFG